MEITRDYFKDEMLIIFDFGEDPLTLVPEGWKVVEIVMPETWRGFTNMGTLTCVRVKKKQNP